MAINATTIRLSITRWQLALAHIRAYLAQRDPMAVVALPAVILIIGMALSISLYRAVTSVPVTAAQATVAPIFIVQTAPSVAVPTPAGRAALALPTATPHLIVAFDSPNGTAFPDPILEPPPSTWIARWGDGWIEVQWKPNPIWIRAADIGANLADVRPIPSVVIAPAGVPQPVQEYQITHEPQAAPIVMTDEQRAAADRQFGLTSSDFNQALAEHNAQQAAWCGDKQTEYCDMVRAAVTR